MPGVYLLIPQPAVPGPGASIDTSTMGRDKFLALVGDATGADMLVEGSQDGVTWETLSHLFAASDSEKLRTTCRFMRLNGTPGPTSKVFVGAAEDPTTQFGALVVPAADGPGPAADLSGAGPIKSFYCAGQFQATDLYLEASNDGVDWMTVGQFLPPDGMRIELESETLAFFRVRMVGYQSGAPVVTFGSTEVGSGGATGVDSPAFVSPEVVTTINARLTGSDTTGNGTLANPYRTFQRAMEDVPHVIGGGQRVVVDVTGIGLEVLPPDYQAPVVKNSSGFELSFTDPDFEWLMGLNIRARPVVVAALGADALISVADIVSIVADPTTTIVTLTIAAPRASWAANALRGKILSGTTAFDGAIISASTPTTLEFGGFVFGPPPVQAFTIKEQSATLQCSTAATFEALNFADCYSIALQGLKITTTTPGSALNVQACSGVIELCDLTDLLVIGGDGGMILWESYIHDGIFTFIEVAILGGCVLFNLPSGSLFFAGETMYLSGCVVDGCGPLGPFVGNVFPFGSGSTLNRSRIRFGIVRNGDADGIALVGGDFARVQGVDISGCAGHAFSLTSPALARVEDVIGAGNGGVGVRLNNGAQAQVNAGTTVTGAGGAYQVGGDAPVAAWPGIAFNDLDLTALFPELCRIFQP